MPGVEKSSVTGSSPAWLKDFAGRAQLLPRPIRLDPTQFRNVGGVRVDVGAAGAAAAATSIPVDALPDALPIGAVLDFGANKFARLTAPALKGATSLTVAAIPTALVDADFAVWNPTATKIIPAGTPVGRTLAEAAANTAYGAAINTDEDIVLTYEDVTDADRNPNCAAVRPYAGVAIAENMLPDYATVLAPAGVASALLTAIRARYNCFISTD